MKNEKHIWKVKLYVFFVYENLGEEYKLYQKKIIHQFFWELLLSLKKFGQNHDFSMLVSHKKFSI
jgi:hypothetical protein